MAPSLAKLAGAAGDVCVHERATVSCVAEITDPTIVYRVRSFHDPSDSASCCTTNESCGASCAAHDTLGKLLVMTERERGWMYG